LEIAGFFAYLPRRAGGEDTEGGGVSNSNVELVIVAQCALRKGHSR
jgi:hypothetical protein